MKKHLFIFLLLVSNFSFAQHFEGTIKWSMTMEITDPKKKAQMEEAQKKMSDPANQAKMKEMEAKMKDPQFKAMMESNPQLKAQMEKMVTAMASGNVNSMIPKGMIVKLKGDNALSMMEGGMFTQEFLYLKDKDQSYMIDRENKTYSLMKKNEKPLPSDDTQYTVTNTGETGKVLQYNCIKYKVDMVSHGHTISQYIWSTKDIKDIDLKSLSHHSNGNNQMFFDKIEGVPLKMEMSHPDGKIVMEVVEIKKASLPASDFAIPADFKEVPLPYGK